MEQLREFNKRKSSSILGSFGDQIIQSFFEATSKIKLEKAHNIELQSAVGIVICNGFILLGLANADDERDNKWCFPGGGIDEGEDCLSASVREVYEEMHISVEPVSQIILTHPTKPKVGFCVLRCTDMITPSINEEFHKAGWFSLRNLPEGLLEINKDILKFLFKDI